MRKNRNLKKEKKNFFYEVISYYRNINKFLKINPYKDRVIKIKILTLNLALSWRNLFFIYVRN